MSAISLGVWTEGQAGLAPYAFRTWTRADGKDWQDLCAELSDPSLPECHFLVVHAGVVWMVADDLSLLVPPSGAEVWQLAEGALVAQGWSWDPVACVASAPPTLPPADPLALLTAFLAANPSVAALINPSSGGTGEPK